MLKTTPCTAAEPKLDICTSLNETSFSYTSGIAKSSLTDNPVFVRAGRAAA